MDIDGVFLDKTIEWINLRCYSNSNEHRKNVTEFIKAKGSEGQVKVDIAFQSFRTLSEMNDELIKLQPLRNVRMLYDLLAFAIINEDYEKATKYKAEINKL